MRLVEDDHPIEVGAQPVHDLLQPRGAVGPGRLPQGSVGRVEDAAVHADGVGLLPGGLWGDVRGRPADRDPVAAGVLQERVVLRQPHGPGAALGQVVGDHAGDLPALAAAGPVAEEEALAKAHGAIVVILDQQHLVRGFAKDPRTGQDVAVRLAGVDHRLELGVGHQIVVRHLRGQHRSVGRRRR